MFKISVHSKSERFSWKTRNEKQRTELTGCNLIARKLFRFNPKCSRQAKTFCTIKFSSFIYDCMYVTLFRRGSCLHFVRKNIKLQNKHRLLTETEKTFPLGVLLLLSLLSHLTGKNENVRKHQKFVYEKFKIRK